MSWTPLSNFIWGDDESKEGLTIMTCRRTLLLGEEKPKNDKPIKDLLLSKNRVVFPRPPQIEVLPRDRSVGRGAEHRRDINLRASYEHRQNMPSNT